MMNYLQFLFKSTNQHGVHSPFVFGYLTKALYHPYRSTTLRKENFIDQTIQYFAPKIIIDLRDSAPQEIKRPFDLIIFPPHQLDAVLQSDTINHFNNDTVAIIDCRQTAKKPYNKLLEHPKVTVVLHFYWYIVFFVRQEQPKELFFLRL